MGMNIYIIILCARCRRGSRPAVSWCAMPLYMVILSAFVPCPVIAPMLHVLPTYARPAAPCAHAVMLAASCLVRILPRRAPPCSRAPAAVSWCAMPLYMVVLPAFAPCPVIVPMLHVLPVYASPAAPHAHAVMLAAPGPVRIMPRRALALLTCARCRMHAAYMSMCLYVYVSTRLHVYMFTCIHVYMFTNYRLKWLIYQQYGTHKETNKDRSNEAPAL